MKMPTPDAAVVARRREIAAHLRTILQPEQVIASEDERRVYESDGLTAYRQSPLIAVLPDRVKRIPQASDRLVFEADLAADTDTALRTFNRFELQIHWKTNFGGCYEDDVYKADLVGRIHELVVSLDRGA